LKLLLAKPLETPSYLNPDHEHAEGLKAAYLFNDQGGKVFDWTQNQNDLSVVNASWVANGLQFDANNEIATLDNTDQKVVHQDQGTILIYFKSYVTFSDGVLHMIFGNYGAALNSGDFIIEKDTNNLLYFIMVDSINHIVAYPNNRFPDWQTGFLFGIHWDKNSTVYDGVNMGISVNGAYVTPSIKANATTWSYTINSSLGILNDPDIQTRYANGMIEYMYIYNKNISLNNVKSICEDPYDMFYNPSNMFLSLLGSYKSALKTKNIYYGANAFPIGRGL